MTAKRGLGQWPICRACLDGEHAEHLAVHPDACACACHQGAVERWNASVDERPPKGMDEGYPERQPWLVERAVNS